MNDIRLVAGVLDHPKTIRLIRACGQEGFFCLLRLWFWARDYRPDGMLAMDPEAIEIVAKWHGEKGLFHSTLVALGWIDPDGGLHDWAHHQTWAVGQKARTEKARAASKARWDARFGPKQQDPDARSIPKSKNEQTLEESPSPLLSSPKPKVKTSSSSSMPEGFEQFWAVYPKRKGKADAIKAWKKTAGVPLETILAAVEAQSKTHDWTKSDGQYIPYPASWLNAGRWTDEVSVRDPNKLTPAEQLGILY